MTESLFPPVPRPLAKPKHAAVAAAAGDPAGCAAAGRGKDGGGVMSLTGDPLTDSAVGPAARLVRAVRRQDAAAVAATLAELRAGGPDAVAAALLVLAAMVPDDTTARVLLAWLADPAEYRRLRSCGVSSLTAGARVRMRANRREEIA